jgi:hypothetical protein
LALGHTVGNLCSCSVATFLSCLNLPKKNELWCCSWRTGTCRNGKTLKVQIARPPPDPFTYNQPPRPHCAPPHTSHIMSTCRTRSPHSRNAAMNQLPVATKSCSRSPKHPHTQPIPRKPRSFSTRHRVHPMYIIHHTSFYPKMTRDGISTPPPKNSPLCPRSAKKPPPSPLRARHCTHPRFFPHDPAPLSQRPCAHPTRKDTISPTRKSTRSGN